MSLFFSLLISDLNNKFQGSQVLIDPAVILQSVPEYLNNFFRNVRIVDIFDITVIAFFLYIVLNWLRQSASRRSLISFSVLIIIYIFARFSGMYLTERLIQGLFIVILIGLVVVFQSDMRRIIDRLSNWSFMKRSKSTSPTDIATSIITEASARMAEERVGALIVIKGSEEWDRHIHGGIKLDGEVTIPLLRSIFNPKAPGHDGAVLLEGNRLQKFSVHLPLSTNLHKMTRGGTRHTAALGLAEQCDAFVVVVSEERGTISIAKDGRIEELESSSDLKKHLDSFWALHYQPKSGSIKQWWKRRSLLTAAASLILAFVLWIAFAYPSETVTRTYEIPIEYRNLESTNVVLQDSVPSQARVRLSGSDQAFRTLDPSGLVISFDLASDEVDDGILQIDENHINLPPDLRFYDSSPKSLMVNTQSFTEFQVPVKIATIGTLRSGLELVSLTASPNAITILADSTTSLPDSVLTETVNLADIQNSAKIQKRLQIDDNSIRLPDDASNQVYIEIEVRQDSE